MKTLMILLVAAALPCAGHAAPGPAPERFAKAKQAYDESRLEEAIALYEGILGDGYASAALYYNLGNSHFQAGQPGMAVLRYRQGWHLAPRDHALLANLDFTLQSAGALGPEALLAERLLLKLSRTEWILVGAASSTIAAFVVLLIITDPRRRAFYRRLLALGAVLTVLALAGIGAWSLRWKHPEVVVVTPNTKALFAPLETAPPHFDAPEGTIARQIGQSGDWLEIRVGGKTGWISATSGRVVYPCSDVQKL